MNIIESLLEEKIGLDAAAIGRKVIENASGGEWIDAV